MCQLCCNARCTQNAVAMPKVQFSDVPVILNVQQKVEVPQVRYIDKIVDAPIVVALQPVPVDAEALSQEHGCEKLASKKRRLPMETESGFESGKQFDLDARSPVQGGNTGTWWTRPTNTCICVLTPGDRLFRVAPNMGAGGPPSQATSDQEEEEQTEEWATSDPSNGRVLGASGQEARREDGRGSQTSGEAGERERREGGRGVRRQPDRGSLRQDQSSGGGRRQVVELCS